MTAIGEKIMIKKTACFPEKQKKDRTLSFIADGAALFFVSL
jgi:hypothetical protein